MPGGSSFERVDLGFVSAYLLYRGGEAALVDTGVAGSEADIETALASIGLGWDAVGHVIVTHKHPDHQGSLGAVLALAPSAQVYAGAQDIPAMEAVASPTAVGDGEQVFGLAIIETPGHTAGHISVLDIAAGILVTGDALNGVGGGVAGPDSGFSEDMTVALESVAKLAGFAYEVALFGHGEPVFAGAAEQVSELASSLG
jgi:glyoxylase-like metal-dependent hydrolase (beta-lactamase superfamily II)